VSCDIGSVVVLGVMSSLGLSLSEVFVSLPSNGLNDVPPQ